MDKLAKYDRIITGFFQIAYPANLQLFGGATMDQKEPRIHTVNQQETIWQRTSKNIISTLCFHLKPWESDKDDSFEAYLQSPKHNRGPYLDQQLFIFGKKVQFYLVTQSF